MTSSILLAALPPSYFFCFPPLFQRFVLVAAVDVKSCSSVTLPTVILTYTRYTSTFTQSPLPRVGFEKRLPRRVSRLSAGRQYGFHKEECWKKQPLGVFTVPIKMTSCVVYTSSPSTYVPHRRMTQLPQHSTLTPKMHHKCLRQRSSYEIIVLLKKITRSCLHLPA